MFLVSTQIQGEEDPGGPGHRDSSESSQGSKEVLRVERNLEVMARGQLPINPALGYQHTPKVIITDEESWSRMSLRSCLLYNKCISTISKVTVPDFEHIDFGLMRRG